MIVFSFSVIVHFFTSIFEPGKQEVKDMRGRLNWFEVGDEVILRELSPHSTGSHSTVKNSENISLSSPIAIEGGSGQPRRSAVCSYLQTDWCDSKIGRSLENMM